MWSLSVCYNLIMNAMKSLGVMSLLGVLLSTSCLMIGASATPSLDVWFLPGECFGNPVLKSHSVRVVSSRTQFSFGLRIKDFTSERYGKNIRPGTIRYVPSEELYASFGENAQIVKSEYDQGFYDFMGSSGIDPRAELITVVSDGEITLTADKDIAGYKSGENLPVSLKIVKGYGPHPYDFVNQLFEIPLDYEYMLSCSFNVILPVGSDYWQQVAETITFELKMPVKVVMYLNWLNDKISDSDAPVPYEDKVLYCKFTTDFTLK